MNISVVITILNEEKTIARLLRSLLSQTVQPREIIIVDGGSSDNTVVAIENLKFKIKNYRSKLKIFVNPGNRSAGRNYGISKAKNSVIAITDGGCYPKIDWLEKLTGPFEDKDVLAVAGYYRAIVKNPFEQAVAPYFLVMPDKVRQMKEFLPSARSMAIRKSVWKKVGGFPEEFSHNEDLVFDYKVKRSGYGFVFVPEAIVYWHPPIGLFNAMVKFFRFALGDAEAGIKRPKITLIFVRYFVGVVFLFRAPVFLIPLVFSYLVWSIAKNFRYASSLPTVLWLSVIQVISDIAIMAGFSVGKLKWIFQW